MRIIRRLSNPLKTSAGVPNPTSMGFYRWKEDQAQAILNACPVSRATTYYVDNVAGVDGNNGLTPGTAWKTIAKIRDTITAAPATANMAFLMNRGVEWNEPTVTIAVNKNNVTISDYGTGNKPFINRFSLKYNAAGWALAAGNRYTRAEASTVGNIRFQGWDNSKSTATGFVLSRQTSQADCEATSNSWFYTAGTLHVNLGGTNPNSVNLEAVASNTIDGIIVTGNGCRINNIRHDGAASDPTNPHTPQSYQFKSAVTGSSVAAFTGCEGYYGGTHIIASYTTGPAGGSTLFQQCSAGFCLRNVPTGETSFNTYASNGNQISIFKDCTVVAGTLPTGVAAWLPQGRSLYGHTGGAGATVGLVIVDRLTTLDSAFTAGGLTSIGDTPACLYSPESCRVFVIEERHTGRSLTTLPFVGMCWINCEYDLTPNDLFGQSFFAAGNTSQTFDGFVFNCILKINLINQSSTSVRSLFNALGTLNHYFWLHNRIDVACDDNSWRTDFDSAGTDSSPDARVYNNIFSKRSGSPTVQVGMVNKAAFQISNAYWDISGSAGVSSQADYGLAANRVALSSNLDPYYTPIPGDQVYRAGTSLARLEYDLYWNPRNLAAPSIGPIEE
jgi:hypothetical protein